MGESNDLQNQKDKQPMSSSAAAAIDSFMAGSSQVQYQESNPWLSSRYPRAASMSAAFQNQNDSSNNDQYPISFAAAAATDSFMAGSSSGMYQELNPMGPSNQSYASAPSVSASFGPATNNLMGSSSEQYNPGPSNQNHGSAPLVSNNGLQNHDKLISDEQYLASIPIGYWFRPKDLELVEYYLLRKAMDNPLPQHRIWTIDVYESDPDVLTASFPLLRETEWYFYSSRKKKYPKGCRPNRATPHGFWKPTGAVINIRDHRGTVVGKKTVLDFYEGKPKDGAKIVRTTWKMHEYVLAKDDDAPNSSNKGMDMLLDKVVMCKIYQLNAARTKLQGDGSSSSTTCENNSPHHPNLPTADPQGSHFGQPISLAPPTNDIAGSSSGLFEVPLTQYNLGPSDQYTDWTYTASGSNMLLDDFPRAAGSYLQRERGSSSVTVHPHGGHFGQPGSFAPATDNIAGFPSWPSQEYSYSMPYNHGPSNQNESRLLVSELGVTNLAATTNNIPSFPSEQYQQPFTSTHYNHQPSSMVFPSGPHQEPFPSTQGDMGHLNPYRSAHLELARGGTGWFGTAENISYESSVAVNHHRDDENNVNRLAFDLDHRSTPLVPRAVDSTLTPPTVHQPDDLFFELQWVTGSFNDTDGKG